MNAPRARLSKGQRRLNTILQSLPTAREQLLVAMEEFPPGFDRDTFTAAAQSANAKERNRVAVIERTWTRISARELAGTA